MGKLKEAAVLIALSIVFSVVVVAIDLAVILVFIRDTNLILSDIILVMLAEGGVGLVVGGGIAFFSRAINKVTEGVFHSEPWTAERQREAERQGRIWIVTAIFLVAESFIISAL